MNQRKLRIYILVQCQKHGKWKSSVNTPLYSYQPKVTLSQFSSGREKFNENTIYFYLCLHRQTTAGGLWTSRRLSVTLCVLLSTAL